MVVCPSCPQAWETPGRVERQGRFVSSSIGSASMSARRPTERPGPLPSMIPTTPVPPMPACTSIPHSLSFSTTMPEVRTSWKPISGWAWMSRRIAAKVSRRSAISGMTGMGAPETWGRGR